MRRRGVGLVAAVLLMAGASYLLRGNRAPASTSPMARPNVLLVTIDTLRADHLGCYGSARASTPVLDGLAGRGVRFTTAIAHVPLTAPSHASMLTGQTPLSHGVRDNGGFVLPVSIRTLAEDFRAAGYRTGAFVSGFPLNRRFGLDRGFETYDDHLPRGNDPRRTAHVERPADGTTDVALRWLEARKSSSGEGRTPWFAWVHYYDPHAPYEPPGTLGPRFASSPYDGEVAFVDQELGRLLRGVEAEGGGGDTIVLVTADHGESLGEHGEDTHGIFVYDATLRVPWIMAGPGVPVGRVSPTVARGIDVAPTLLDYAGLAALPGVDGRSLRPAAEGRAMEDAPTYAESLHAQLQYGWAPLHAWRTAGFKLIGAPRPELYDLEKDAAETHDRAPREPERLAAMKQTLQAALSTPTPTASAAVDAETAARLAALGYVGGGRSQPAPGSPARDPKDGIGLATRLGRTGMAVARTDPELAIRELTALLADDRGMLVARRTRAVAYEAAGRYEAAVADLRALEKEGALSAEDAVVLGDSLRMAGRPKEAVEVLERTARANPKFAQPWLSIAAVLFGEEKSEQAAEAYEKALQIEPDHIEALRGLGDLALVRGDTEAAARRYSRILEVDPHDAGALSKLGVLSARAGRGDEAIALFRKAVEREPKNADALLYLAGALASNRRSAEAVPFFERALAAGPRSTMALNGLGLTRLELGDRKGAAEAFKESLALDPRQPDIVKALSDLRRPGPTPTRPVAMVPG